nr:hypothetical protein CFP56_70704 [Quercus suber]
MSDIRRYIRFKCNHLIDSHFLSSLSHIALFLYRKLRKVCSFCSVPHASGSASCSPIFYIPSASLPCKK